MSWKLDIEQQITDLNRRVSELESRGKEARDFVHKLNLKTQKDAERVKETPKKKRKQ